MTHIFQPVDVCLAKPLNEVIKAKFMSWVERSTSEAIVNVIKAPTDDLLIDWVMKSMQNLTISLVKKSFQAARLLRGL